VVLTHYQEVARFVGLNPYRMLARAGLNVAGLSDPENWLPAIKVLSLLDDSARRSGRDDFGVLLGKCRSFTSLGPISVLLKHEATVRDILLAAAEYKHILNDLLNITLRDDGDITIVEWNLVPGLRSSQGINLLAAIAYRAISEAVESVWEPGCIHFRQAVPDRVATFRSYFRCDLDFDSHFDGMSCTSNNLGMRNPFANRDLAGYARRLLDLLPGVRHETVSDKVRSIIPLVIEDGQATTERVANCLGLSARTLQRRLSCEEACFSRLLCEGRRDLAIRYMTSSSHDLAVIAQLMGYSSLSAFSRWFRAEFEMAPARWRKHHGRDYPNSSRRNLARSVRHA